MTDHITLLRANGWPEAAAAWERERAAIAKVRRIVSEHSHSGCGPAAHWLCLKIQKELPKENAE